MKKIFYYFFVILIFYCPFNLFSQGVAINTSGITAHPSAILDIQSTEKGLLFPRLSETDIIGIPTPAMGLVVFNTTTNQLNYFDGTFWKHFQDTTSSTYFAVGALISDGVSINTSGLTPHHSALLDINSQSRGLILPRTTEAAMHPNPAAGLMFYNISNNNIGLFIGNEWKYLCGTGNSLPSAGSQAIVGVAINEDGSPADPSAILDINAVNKGLLMPRFTNSERDNIPNPALGLFIYNSEAQRLEFFNGNEWRYLIHDVPPTPLSISGQDTVCPVETNVYSINAVNGASYYHWTVPAGWVILWGQGTTSITVNSGNAGDNGNISVSAGNICGTSLASNFAVVVTHNPPVPTIITDCSLGPNNGIIQVTAPLGTIYQYSLNSGFQSSPIFNNLQNGNYIIFVLNTIGSGCISQSSTINLNCGCTNQPTVTLSALSNTGCANIPFTLNGNTFGGSATHVMFATSGSGTLTPQTTNTSPFSFTYTPGTADIGTVVSITVTTDNPQGAPCVSDSETFSLTVNTVPSQPGTISGSTTFCAGGTYIYSIAPISGATSYTWSYSGSSNSLVSYTGTSCSLTPTTGGILSVVANNSCGSSTSRTLNISILTAPTQPGVISGSTTFCAGGTYIYSIAPISGATSYTWSYSGSSNSVTGYTGTSCSLTPTTGGTLSVVASNSCGSSTSRTLNITVGATPTSVTVTGGGTWCFESQTLTATGGTGGTIYWQNTTSNGTSTATPATTRKPTTNGTYYFRARSADGCWGLEGSATVTIVANPTVNYGCGFHPCIGGQPDVNLDWTISLNCTMVTTVSFSFDCPTFGPGTPQNHPVWYNIYGNANPGDTYVDSGWCNGEEMWCYPTGCSTGSAVNFQWY